MKNSELKNLKLYPHFKLTNEKFPRLLVTRKIENDNAEYFGAFLPKTGARILLGFVNQMFKLRSCETDIDGGLPFPCPMFYRKRCLAPCVENICGEVEYAESVELLRLFLGNKRGQLKENLTARIEKSAEEFDFENAAKWRDILFEFEEVWQNKRWKYWLDEAIDSWEITSENSNVVVNLVTQRGRKILGNRSFLLAREEHESIDKIIERIFLHFYRVYIPKEIRVFEDFQNRKVIAAGLSKKFGRKLEINVQKNLTPTTAKGLRQTEFDSVIGKISVRKNYRDIQRDVKKIFKLKKIPNRIETYDVAHLSGTNVVASKVVWENGEILANQNDVWFFQKISEPNAITEAIRQRFSAKSVRASNDPDLLLIDGGKTQLNAALEGVSDIVGRTFKIISAVKPPGKHNEISHFLDENLNRIEIAEEDTFFFLTNLRDKSHELANRSHSNIRDTNHFYELATLLPDFSERKRREALHKAGSLNRLKEADLDELKTIFSDEIAVEIYNEIRGEKYAATLFAERIIPIRFDAESGNASNLQPIIYRNNTKIR